MADAIEAGVALDLELGCGARKRDDRSFGIDAIESVGVDIVGDVFEALRVIPSARVASVTSFHFFEHIQDVGALMGELARVMIPGSSLTVSVPHFSNSYFYSDPTHKTPFGLYTFCYLAESTLFFRRVPAYARSSDFSLVDVSLGFKATPPFYIRHGFRRLLGVFVNSCRYIQETYEDCFCFWLPCYEITYSLRRK